MCLSLHPYEEDKEHLIIVFLFIIVCVVQAYHDVSITHSFLTLIIIDHFIRFLGRFQMSSVQLYDENTDSNILYFLNFSYFPKSPRS